MFYLAKKRFTERKFKKKANESDYIIYNFISLHCIFYPAAQVEDWSQFFSEAKSNAKIFAKHLQYFAY